MGYFKDVTPESAGISSKGILNFLDRIEENQIELHSFMVIRHGQCAAKGWWKPYDEKFRHPLYSFSKSLTATAIGFAEQEGILSLDEKIVDIFPDLLPENPSENLKKITLHHLLIMGCGHETEIMDNSENWISTFLHHPVLHEPGTFYKYNTAGTNMLAAVLRKKNGTERHRVSEIPSAGAAWHHIPYLCAARRRNGARWRRYEDGDGGYGKIHVFSVQTGRVGRKTAASKRLV